MNKKEQESFIAGAELTGRIAEEEIAELENEIRQLKKLLIVLAKILNDLILTNWEQF